MIMQEGGQNVDNNGKDGNIIKEKKAFTPTDIRIFWSRVKKLKIILKTLKEGNSMMGACKAANIGIGTFWRWRNKPYAHSNFNDLIFKILDARNMMMEDAHYKAGMDGNVTAQMNWLYNRVGERWQDKRAVAQTNQNLNLTQNKISIEAIDESTIRRVAGNIGSLRKYGIIDAEVSTAEHKPVL